MGYGSAGQRRVRWTLRGTAVSVMSFVIAGGMIAVAPSPASAAPQPAQTKPVPPLPSTAAPRLAPSSVAGDFRDAPPHPDQLTDTVRTPKSSTFDPATSKVVDADTTPTKLNYRNADGTYTAVLSTKPVRYRDPQGVWRDIDLTVVAGADGSLGAKSSDGAVKLPARADGPITLNTKAGAVQMRRRGASASTATAGKDTAAYAKALGGSDIRVALRADGFEDFVVLADARAPASYTYDLALPAGVSARDAEGGVELVDGSGAVVATINNGWAADAHQPMPALSPVAVRLAAPPGGGTAAVEVALRDPSWLADSARQWPITIDPSTTISGSLTYAQDAMVLNGANANANFGGYPELWEAVDGTGLARIYLRFDGLPTGANYWVNESHLVLSDFANQCPSPAPALEVGSPGGSWSEATLTWNNAPIYTNNSTTPAYSSPLNPNYGTTTPAPACVAGTVQLDTTWLAFDWMRNSFPNNGVVIRDAAESNPTARSRKFYSTEGAVPPQLSISYGIGSQPDVAQADAAAPANGAVIGTTTPTLSVANAVDADGESVRYWFRATPAPDAETGARVVDSGWVKRGDPGCPTGTGSCAYTVPAGSLADGVSYSWHVWTVRHEAP